MKNVNLAVHLSMGVL